MIDVQFAAAERADLVVGFTGPVPGRALREIAHLPGVLLTEAFRSVPVRLRAGTRTYRTAITGLPRDPMLRRLLDNDLRVHPPPRDGLLLSRRLGRTPAPAVRANRRHRGPRGRATASELPVVGLVDDLIGLGAYMQIGTLNRLMGEARQHQRPSASLHRRPTLSRCAGC